MPVTQIPIADGLFIWPSDSPELIGARCSSCGTHTFPAQSTCPRCFADGMEQVHLSRRGTLWTWTTQGFLPKSPPYAGTEDAETFEPYAVGYVELPGQCRVEARLTENDPERLKFGMELELTVVPFRVDESGNEVVMFAFRPIGEQAR